MIGKLFAFVRAVRRFRMTPIVDDDFGEMRDNVDNAERELSRMVSYAGKPPMVVCLCGSTKFIKQYQEIMFKLTLEGKVVLTVGDYPRTATQYMKVDGCMGDQEAQVTYLTGTKHEYTPEQKRDLDVLHKWKIMLADEVYIINVGGYLGESTRDEIRFAKLWKKPITYMEPMNEDHH
jgi:hypothetical protein